MTRSGAVASHVLREKPQMKKPSDFPFTVDGMAAAAEAARVTEGRDVPLNAQGSSAGGRRRPGNRKSR